MDGMRPKDAGPNDQTLALRVWRSPMIWPLLLVGAIFLFAACGGGKGAADDIFTDMDTADEEAVGDFELVVFGTENYTKGERIRLSQYLGQPLVVNFWFPSCPPLPSRDARP